MKIALKDMEHIRQIYRQSGFVLVHPIAISVLAIAVPWYAILRYGAPEPLKTILLIWTILVLGHVLRAFLIWRLNRYVVTNKRLLIYIQKGLFDQTVIETPHERILNVSYKTEGFLSSVIGYGDVEVQVVGLVEPMILKNISMPMEIKDYLWDMHNRIAKDKSNTIYADSDATHIQEQVGYTKKNQRII